MAPWTTPEFTVILSDNLERFGEAEFAERREIIKDIKQKIILSAETNRLEIPHNLTVVIFQRLYALSWFSLCLLQEIRSWLHNNRRTPVAGPNAGRDEHTALKFSNRGKWTLQSVVEQHEKQRIYARAETLSNADRGSIQFLASYRRARTEICEELSEEEHARYEMLAHKWNREPVPQMVQRE